ncbi:MAG TPA: DUF72 domain-containing protein [Rariglobus sp.]
MATARIGISGWRYPPWRGVFYPKGLPQRNELAYASSIFPSIEINGSFYSLQRPSSWAAWQEATPAHFRFSVKAPRFITHIKRLRGVDTALANFWASGVLRLNEKLGPILWQFPPSFRYDSVLMEEFFEKLPRTTADALAQARRHDEHVYQRTWLKIDRRRRLRHAIEIRHRTFATPAFIRQLRRHRIGLVVADTAGKWPFIEDVTADFVYVRLHGDEVLYTSGYTEEALDRWAIKIAAWTRGAQAKGVKTLLPPVEKRPAGRDVFVYFDNDVKVRAPYDAMSLSHRLGLGPAPINVPPIGSIREVARVNWPLYGRKKSAR